MEYITPNDDGIVADTDWRSVQNAVDAAHKNGCSVLIPRVNERTGESIWIFEAAVLLPSDIEVILDNCHIRLADGIYDNVFRNANIYDREKNYINLGRQHNIHIRGVGNTVLDGGKHNGLLELNSRKKGIRMQFNNLILLHNVENFTIENLDLQNQRHWAVNILFSSHGRISDIRLYGRNNIPNQDGIDIRMGCSHLVIEGISGQSGDDLVAITTQGSSNIYLPTEDCDRDVHHVIIRNVVGTSKAQALVALRNHDGSKLYDIEVLNVMDSRNDSKDCHPYGVLRVGENLYYRDRPSEMGETYNIRAKNIFAQTNETICVGATLRDCTFESIYVSDMAHCAVCTDHQPHQDGGVRMENVVFDGIHVRSDRKSFALTKFNTMREGDGFKNVVIKNVHGAEPVETEGIKYE